MNVAFLINPLSGAGRGAGLLASIESLISANRLLGAAFSVFDEDVWAKVKQYSPEAILLGGGDGTISCSLDHLLALGLPCALAPLGTANDLARALGVLPAFHQSIETYVGSLALASSQPVTVWELQSDTGARQVWCNYVSFGFDAAVVHRFASSRGKAPKGFLGVSLNRVRYGFESLRCLSEGVATGELSDDGGGRRGIDPCRSVVLANIPSYMGMGPLSRRIVPSDKVLQVVCMRSLWSFFQSAVLGLDDLIVGPWQGGDVICRSLVGGACPVQVDGEPMLGGTGERWHVSPRGQVRFLIPHGE